MMGIYGIRNKKETTNYEAKIDTIRKSLNKGKYRDFTVRFL